MHPHPPRAVHGGQRRDHRGGGLTAIRWSRLRRRRRPASVPRNRLRDAPTSTGMPVATNSGSACSSAQLCCAVLAKPSPGSMISFGRIDAGGHRGVDAGQQLGRAPRRPRRGSAGTSCGPVGRHRPPVHQHPRHVGLGQQRRHGRVGAAAGHVVDDRRAVFQRRPRHVGVHGVDADRNTLGGKLFDDRDDTGGLDSRIDRGSRRAGSTRRRRRRSTRRRRPAPGRARRPVGDRGSVRRRRTSRR